MFPIHDDLCVSIGCAVSRREFDTRQFARARIGMPSCCCRHRATSRNISRRMFTAQFQPKSAPALGPTVCAQFGNGQATPADTMVADSVAVE